MQVSLVAHSSWRMAALQGARVAEPALEDEQDDPRAPRWPNEPRLSEPGPERLVDEPRASASVTRHV